MGEKNPLCDLQISKRIMFVLRDSPMSHSSALIFQRKEKQASESDLSIWRSVELQSRLTEPPSVILPETRTVNHIP